MKTIETTSLRSDIILAIIAALQLVGSLSMSSWPLRSIDVIFAMFWSLFLGIEGTIAVLKYRGTIQVREPSPEETLRTQKLKAIFLIGIVVVMATILTWSLRR